MPTLTRRTIIIMAAILIAAIIVFYALVDPMSAYVPKCWIKAVTGYDCPGCGSQRWLHAMLHGEFDKACQANAAMFFILPAGLAYLVIELKIVKAPRLERLLFNPMTLYAVAAAIVAWWIFRNLSYR